VTVTDTIGNSNSCSFTVTVTVGNQCPLGMGFWKTHPNLWPVTSLTLGSVTYDQAHLLSILDSPTRGDASLILAKQLIAALLNQANGSSPVPLCATFEDANSLLDSCTLPCHVRPSSAKGQAMVADGATLEAYNEGLLTPGCAHPIIRVGVSSDVSQ
jgi:hypothetical protein